VCQHPPPKRSPSAAQLTTNRDRAARMHTNATSSRALPHHAIHSSVTCLAKSDGHRLEWVFLSRLTGVMMNGMTDDEVHKFLSDNEWHFRISAEANVLRYPNPEAN
jgi:hypothetical protein